MNFWAVLTTYFKKHMKSMTLCLLPFILHFPSFNVYQTTFKQKSSWFKTNLNEKETSHYHQRWDHCILRLGGLNFHLIWSMTGNLCFIARKLTIAPLITMKDTGGQSISHTRLYVVTHRVHPHQRKKEWTLFQTLIYKQELLEII